MCGIIGAYSFNLNEKINVDKINLGLELMNHRGPDNKNCVTYNQCSVVLGHTRLSIIDLSQNANQPMSIGDYKIIFNGEIYNYIEIKGELTKKGYNFLTDSDTEVLVNAYDYWGEFCVEKFNGMWAFAILNEKTRTLFCSRDRFGVKPFNYYLDNDKLIFASECKAILAYDDLFRKPNYNAIALYCREGICGEIEETWFEGIKRLMPGHNLFIDNGIIKISNYYKYPNNIQNISFDEAKNKFKEILIDSVKIRMRSDVPVGTTLSGGLDSSSIVSILRTFYNGKHDSFTACFKNYHLNEYDNAHKTNSILKLEENIIDVEYDNNYLDLLNKIVYHLESGHLSPSVYVAWKVYENCKNKATVILEGQGADELLGGYINSSSGSFLLDSLMRFKFRNFFKQFYLLKKNYDIKQIMIIFIRIYSPSFIKKFFRKYILNYESVFIGHIKKFDSPKITKSNSRSFFINSLQDSHRGTLVNLLHYGDALSMAFSLESRLPFLDYRLVDFCFTLPSEYLVNDGKGKYILREALKDLLPSHISNDHKKIGFASPIDTFFKDFKNEIKQLLLNDLSTSRNLFNREKLESMIDSVGFKHSSERVIFRIICVELWYKNFIDA